MILDTDRIQSDAAYKDELRHRCETDHFFLAELMGFDKFVPHLHQPVKDLYFPKNRNIPIEDQHPVKYRMHLDPRHTYKTTMGIVDTTQWILAFPELVSIVNETATQPLAKALTNVVANRFYKRERFAPTPLQLLYPELLISKEPDAEYTAPTRTQVIVEATLGYTSPKTSQSGWHPWVLNPDDMVDATNSGISASETSRNAIIAVYHANRNTLRLGGYLNVRGTRYHPFDLYGDLLDKMDPSEWKLLIRSSMTIKTGQRLLPGEFPDAEDVILHFPELLPYTMLRGLFFANYESFMCQQQNDPQGGNVPTFDADLFATMEIAAERVPALGESFICWRLPYTGKPYMAKFAEGAVARVYEGKCYILDAWQGTYTPSRLAEKIVRECKRHQTGTVIVESLPGVQYIEPHIRNEARIRNESIHIQWLEFEEDDNDRFSRIRNLEPQARAGKILVSTACGRHSELRRQFLNFGLVSENGILDAISRLGASIPVSNWRQEIEDEEKELHLQRRNEVLSQFVYGGQMPGTQELEASVNQEQQAHDSAMHAINNLGLTDILGGLDG